MNTFLQRTELLIGKENILLLNNANILVVGLGGVGGYAAEALVRSGIGNITIIDGDYFQISNINRQLSALHSTLDSPKAEIMEKRLLDINPKLKIKTISSFLGPQDIETILIQKYDFVLDCIDTIAPKIELITACKRKQQKFISSMGAGGKIDPSRVKIDDLVNTRDCYFSRDIRKKLRRMNYNYGIKVVYSDEYVSKSKMELTNDTLYKKSYYGTISYMPAIFGLMMSSYVIRKLCHNL